jgi:predicted O-methyltransferase YrrM
MRPILRLLKRIWFLNFIRRIAYASTYYNKKYPQILKWGFTSREDTNFTYDLSEGNISYMAHTIAAVTKKDYQTILNYFNEAANNKELMTHILSETAKSEFGRYADKEIRFGKRLGWYTFVRIMKPKVVIETGIDKGLGSVVLCAALLKNKEEGFEGRYYGTDINPQAGYLLSGKYKEVGEVLYGDSIESLKKFNQQIDLFINDSDHSAEYEYQEYLTIEKLLNDKSIILGDNANCTDKLAAYSAQTGRNFLYFQEEPKNHWYPGAGIGISYK